MMKIDREFSRSVFEDGMLAAEDLNHPCRHMVDWQLSKGFSSFQLPEPFGGATSDIGLAFLGLNPSISQSRSIPKAESGTAFEIYDDFYRKRFESIDRRSDGSLSERTRLWLNIERFGRKHLKSIVKGSFEIGHQAVLLDAVRYKSTEGWLGDNKVQRDRVLAHQKPFTNTLLEVSGCRILMPMGREGISQVNQLLKLSSPIPENVRDAMGNMYVGETKNGLKIFVCPIKHMSYCASKESEAAVGRQVVKAYELASNDGEFPQEAA